MTDNKSRIAPVPQRRFARLLQLGGMTADVAGGMVAEGFRQLARDNVPGLNDMLLTPGNAVRASNNTAPCSVPHRNQILRVWKR